MSQTVIFDCDFSQSGNLSLSLFSVLRSDCLELDFKEISYLVELSSQAFSQHNSLLIHVHVLQLKYIFVCQTSKVSEVK